VTRSKDKEEAYFSGKTPPGEMALYHIRQYISAEPPSQNTKLHQMLMKLDGYGVSDQQKRLLLLTDQNNRTYALRYLAQHLDLIHTVDLVQSLHVQMMKQIMEFGNGHFDGFTWPWQWGPEPAKADPIQLPPLTQENAAIPQKEIPVARRDGTEEPDLYGGPTYAEVREVMVQHEIQEIIPQGDDGYPVVRCACGKIFEGADAEVKYNKHIRARVKELLNVV